jgi:hypothetical protein
MNIDDVLKKPELQKAAVTFASGYAKRMMEAQYDRSMETNVAQRLTNLPRPRKYAIEVALNGIVAYLATKEQHFEKNPVAALIWEVGKDASSELSKRLLNGKHEKTNAVTEPHGMLEGRLTEEEERSVIEGLLQMNPQDLGAFLTWLQAATPEERSSMAESMSRLTGEQHAKLSALSPEQMKMLFAATAPPPAVPREKVGKSVFSSLMDALRLANERLEKRDHE